MLSPKTMSGERGLREAIIKNLNKQIHPHTKPSLDFIAKILDDAHKQGMAFDVSDMWDDILSFAMSSQNQRTACIEIAMKLKLTSDVEAEAYNSDLPEIVYDLEVYPNLFAIGWMYDRDDAQVVRMVNPTAQEVQDFIEKFRRWGFNNRKYDAHILWAASMGADTQEIYNRSQAIVGNKENSTFLAAYKIDEGDLYDISTVKQTLKKWQIELGLPHMEMDLPWDQPVPEDRILDVLDYMDNDVRSTRALKQHLEPDINARRILAELTGLSVINTNRQLAEKLIFGDVPWDQKPDLVYTDLTEMFPGYEFDRFAPGKEKSTYKGVSVGEGGWVYSEPGMYHNVTLLDVASMHPTSIIEMNVFSEYTKKFADLLDVRLAIKAKDLDKAAGLFDGRLKPYLGSPEASKQLSDALKIVVNSVYGLTAASFPNKFKDERNIDNIVAKRGALFMVDLKEYIEGLGLKVIHIKTDSVKVVDAEEHHIKAIQGFSQMYGYTLEHEATYERFCLLNDAVYVCREDGKWSATGAQFLHKVVFKTLFSKEELTPRDYVEVKQVAKGAMYLVSEPSGVRTFVGRFGAFIPVLGGRTLLRVDGEKEAAVAGTKGFLWEIDDVALSQNMDVDYNYFQELINEGMRSIEKFGSYADFTRP